MSVKIVTVIVTFCLVQNIAATTPIEALTRNALLDSTNLIQTLQTAIRSTQQRVHAIAQQVAQVGNNQITSSRLEIQALAKRIDDGGGGDLTSCTEDQSQVIADLVQRVEGEVFTCVVDQVNKISVVVADVASRANDAISVLQVSISNISTCLERPLFAPQCILDVRIAAEAEADVIIAALAADLEAAENILESAPGQISECASEQLSNASADAEQIIVDIAQCIVDGSASTTQAPILTAAGWL